MAQDQPHHGLVTLAGRAVEHRQPVLVLVQETGPASEQSLYDPSVTLLYGAAEWGRPVLAFGVNILTDLNEKFSDISESGNSCMVKSSITKFIFLENNFLCKTNNLDGDQSNMI